MNTTARVWSAHAARVEGLTCTLVALLVPDQESIIRAQSAVEARRAFCTSYVAALESVIEDVKAGRFEYAQG